MSHNEILQRQEQNTAKLVMNTFYKVAGTDGVTADEITRYLQEKFGDVWRMNALTGKAEETLKRSAALGFLDRLGDRYVAKIAREMGCCRRRRKRRRSCRRKKKRRRSCRRRRRRRSRRRRRRKRSCCCGK
ncbi:protamine-like [Ostrinia nubilalis]|uniref:protamine-like n=1 Tax=Ostrinia furnacalis TaxID=93504 RepID=UPI001039ADD8|nr:protamine-like [Ostrinia furnacalis]